MRIARSVLLLPLVLGLTAGPVMAEKPHKGFWRKMRRVSEFVLGGSQALDIHSSLSAPQGVMEANPLLRGSNGRLGARGVAIKLAIVGGALAVERLTNKNGRYDKTFAITNLALSGVTTGVAVHNYRLNYRLSSP